MIRKICLTAFAMLLLMGATTETAHAQIERSKHFSDEFQWRAIESTVRIRTETGQGTGVVVAHRNGRAVILSAAHVVEGAKRIEVDVFTRKSYPKPARIFVPTGRSRYNVGDDTAILIVKMPVPMAANLVPNASYVQKGQPVLSVGCGKGAPPVNQVAALTDFEASGDYIVDRGSINGRSGGPLFNQHGLIGILSRGRNDETVFVSFDKIYGLVKRYYADQLAGR